MSCTSVRRMHTWAQAVEKRVQSSNGGAMMISYLFIWGKRHYDLTIQYWFRSHLMRSWIIEKCSSDCIDMVEHQNIEESRFVCGHAFFLQRRTDAFLGLIRKIIRFAGNVINYSATSQNRTKPQNYNCWLREFPGISQCLHWYYRPSVGDILCKIIQFINDGNDWLEVSKSEWL